MKFAVKKHDAPDCCAFSRWKDPTLLLVYGSIDVHIVQGDLWLFDGFQGRGSCTLQKVSGAWTVHCLRIIDSKKSPTTGINSKLKQLNKKTGVFFEITSPDNLFLQICKLTSNTSKDMKCFNKKKSRNSGIKSLKKSFISYGHIWYILRCWGKSSLVCQQKSDAL